MFDFVKPPVAALQRPKCAYSLIEEMLPEAFDQAKLLFLYLFMLIFIILDGLHPATVGDNGHLYPINFHDF